MSKMFTVVEKKNHLAVHALCESRKSAERWLAIDCVYACERGFFMDKTLTPDDFEILPPGDKQTGGLKMGKVHITSELLAAINSIMAAGYGVELRNGMGGTSHSVVVITIGCRLPGEMAYFKKLDIKCTSSYSMQFFDFIAISPEFGELCYSKSLSVSPFLSAIEKIISRTLLTNAKHADNM